MSSTIIKSIIIQKIYSIICPAPIMSMQLAVFLPTSYIPTHLSSHVQYPPLFSCSIFLLLNRADAIPRSKHGKTQFANDCCQLAWTFLPQTNTNSHKLIHVLWVHKGQRPSGQTSCAVCPSVLAASWMAEEPLGPYYDAVFASSIPWF